MRLAWFFAVCLYFQKLQIFRCKQRNIVLTGIASYIYKRRLKTDPWPTLYLTVRLRCYHFSKPLRRRRLHYLTVTLIIISVTVIIIKQIYL
jgi:hypothetical protein